MKGNNMSVTLTKVFLACLITSTIVIIAARSFIMFTKVEGMSMYPTLHDKESVVVNKIIYSEQDPERYDIVIFKSPLSETGHFIKRVIGLPGETIKIDKAGNIYVDGKILDEDYGYQKINDGGRAANGITLGRGEYFVMGDNRNHSEDSRFAEIGNIEKEDILGRVNIRLKPLEKFGYIDLYLERQRKGD